MPAIFSHMLNYKETDLHYPDLGNSFLRLHDQLEKLHVHDSGVVAVDGRYVV